MLQIYEHVLQAARVNPPSRRKPLGNRSLWSRCVNRTMDSSVPETSAHIELRSYLRDSHLGLLFFASIFFSCYLLIIWFPSFFSSSFHLPQSESEIVSAPSLLYPFREHYSKGKYIGEQLLTKRDFKWRYLCTEEPAPPPPHLTSVKSSQVTQGLKGTISIMTGVYSMCEKNQDMEV